jgi:hypothetical protein
MDENSSIDFLSEPQPITPPWINDASAEYAGRWHRLVSTTNWEKGRIICSWRAALMEAGAAVFAYSDEAWSQIAGSISPQHVGRLRRVFERFGGVQQQYAGLYWSHFLSALDWPDAEMWLEGAVQSGWSAAAMRRKRWETIGATAETQTREEDVVAAEFDEDGDSDDAGLPEIVGESTGLVQPVGDGLEIEQEKIHASESDDVAGSFADANPAPVRPFENLAPLPPDLNEAFESFKLAILNHKLSDWREISRREVVAALDALKQLALS